MKIQCTQYDVCRAVAALLVVTAATACSRREEQPAATATAATASAGVPVAGGPFAADTPIPATASPYDALPAALRLVLDQPFTGDLDELVTRRAIRVAVTFNRTHYFIDRGQERGLTYEALKSFENDLNTDLKTGTLKVHVVPVPMSRDQLYPALAGGKVDMVAAMVTVRPELEKLVAFSEPTRTNVSQVVVTGPGAPPIAVGGRSGRSGGVRPQGERLPREPHPAERATESARQAGSSDRRGPGRAGRRRRARDGERRSRARYGRGRLPGGVLEPDIHRHRGAPRHRPALRRHPGRRLSPRESQAPGGRQRMDPEARKGRPVPKRDRTALSQERQVPRRTPRPMPSARSSRRWSNCSRSTVRNTTSITC